MYHSREERHLYIRPASQTPEWWDVPEGANRRPQGCGMAPHSRPPRDLWWTITEGANAPFRTSWFPVVGRGGTFWKVPFCACRGRGGPRLPVRHVRLPPRPPVCVPNLKTLWISARGLREGSWLRTPLCEAAVGGAGKLAVSSVGIDGGSA